MKKKKKKKKKQKIPFARGGVEYCSVRSLRENAWSKITDIKAVIETEKDSDL